MYIDYDVFVGELNDGYFVVVDLFLMGGIGIVVLINVDMLIEVVGNFLFGYVGVGVSCDKVVVFLFNKLFLLKIYGCWSDFVGIVWVVG